MIKKSGQDYNYGIALLKMLMCFEVVLIHFWIMPATNYLVPFSMMKEFAVPVFMFLSFYFVENSFLIKDHSKTKKRIWRVVFPQIGWSILYWLFFYVTQTHSCLKITFNDLLWQLLTGHSPKLNPTMWFQIVLIFLTLLFVLTFQFLSRLKGLLFIIVITLLSLFIQYSGLNLKFFDSLRFELKYPLGRISEMIPYASIGFFVAYYDVYNRLKKNRLLFIFLFGLAILLLFKYRFIIPSSSGFGYSHNNNLLHVFFIIGFAYLLPFDWISDKIKLIIQYITKFTLGIYCIHRLIAFVVNKTLYMYEININNFTLCIIIYIISFSTSFIIYKLSPRYFKQLVE